MTTESETISKIEGGMMVVNVDGKSLGMGNCPWGTLILTDKRLLFAATPRGSAKVTLAGILTPSWIHQTDMRLATQLKPEEVDEAMKDERSLYVNLDELVDVRSGVNILMIHKLHVKWNMPTGSRTVEIQKGGVGGFRGWVEAIKSAKEGESSTK